MAWDFKTQLQPQRDQQAAQIESSITDRPFAMQKITLKAADFAASNTGNPLEIRIPFRSIFVSSATDSSVKVKLALHDASTLQLDNALTLSIRDSMKFPSMVARAFLFWDAQTGKDMDIFFFTDGEFSSGSLISTTNGGVFVSEGTSVTTRAKTGLAVTSTASVLLPTDSLRACETLVNHEAETVWLGDANVTDDTGTYPGYELVSHGVFIWKNTGSLYAIKKGAGTLTNFSRNVER